MSALDQLLIEKSGVVSNSFLALNCTTFMQAALFVQRLPYHRNAKPTDTLCVLNEKQGTCSTKHQLLMQLVKEQGWKDFRLVCGIFKMTPLNTPRCSTVLQNAQLAYIPEAHCYLYFQHQLLDFTGIGWSEDHFKADLLLEKELHSNLYPTEKVDLHQSYLKTWIDTQAIPYSFEQVWTLREQCIHALFT